MEYIISIDIGTQGTKAGLFDRDLNCISTAFQESELIADDNGIYEEPENIYQSVVKVLNKLSAENAQIIHRVEVIAIDSQMAGIMGVDKDNQAITYYDSWLDTKCADQICELSANEQKMIQSSGGPLSYTQGPKMKWWKEEKPQIWDKIKKFILPHVYVTGRLTGMKAEELYYDYTSLAYSGCGNNLKKMWSEELAELMGLDITKLGKIVSPFCIVGRITPVEAKRCGLREGIPFAAGSGDTSASLYGLGIQEEGSLIDCAGTASVLGGVVHSYVPDLYNQTLTQLRSPEDGVWFPLAYINGGGLDLRWCKKLLGCETYGELEEMASKIEAGSGGLMCIPHFGGRVLPNDSGLRGSFTGVTWEHGKGHFYRAIMESIAYEYKYYLGILKKMYPDTAFHTLHSIGGGSRSALFAQIKADVLGCKVITYEQSDTALLGSAAIGAAAAGLTKTPGSLLKEKRKSQFCYYPKTENALIYEKMSRRYLEEMQILSSMYGKRRNK